MKNLFSLLLLVTCFTFGISTTTDAQVVRNSTDCEFIVQVQYGDSNCDTVAPNIITVTVAPFTQVNLGIPPGQQIIRSRGVYTAGGSCAFYVGLPCSGYDLIDNVDCPGQCGDYTARLIPGLGISLSN